MQAAPRLALTGLQLKGAPNPGTGLTRLTSFMRRKSVLRGKMSSINELSAAMDSLDQRILSSLESLRQQNAAGG